MLETATFQGSFQYYSHCQDVEVTSVPLVDKVIKISITVWTIEKDILLKLNERTSENGKHYSIWSTPGRGENRSCAITHEESFSSRTCWFL